MNKLMTAALVVGALIGFTTPMVAGAQTAGPSWTFLVGVPGTGLARVRIQGRRDARGGWITLADASGSALRETANGSVVKHKPGPRGAVERLRVDLEFRTTNPRTLERIVVNP